MKQSRQCYLPQINPPVPFSEWVYSLPAGNSWIRFLAHLEDSAKNMMKLKWENQFVIAAIGPEGGFSEEEFHLAVENGFEPVRIDNHILRTETAAVIAAAQIKTLIG
jgi:16S rRNA (uracil1498-N3)-methyltransferase